MGLFLTSCKACLGCWMELCTGLGSWMCMLSSEELDNSLAKKGDPQLSQRHLLGFWVRLFFYYFHFSSVCSMSTGDGLNWLPSEATAFHASIKRWHRYCTIRSQCICQYLAYYSLRLGRNLASKNHLMVDPRGFGEVRPCLVRTEIGPLLPPGSFGLCSVGIDSR